jgi:hypothetical protein
MSFQTLPPELVAGILHRAPDFTSLLSMIETCKLAYEVFKSSSDIIVHAMFERTCIRILGAFSTLPKVPGKRNVSQNRKIRQEFIRKQSRPTSKTANLCKPLLGILPDLGLIIQRRIIPKSTVNTCRKLAEDMGLSQILQLDYNNIYPVTVDDRTTLWKTDSEVYMEILRRIEYCGINPNRFDGRLLCRPHRKPRP